MEQTRLDLALYIYDQILAIDSNIADAHFAKATVLYDLDLLDQALVEYKNSIELNYRITECYYSKGKICEEQKKTNEAI